MKTLNFDPVEEIIRELNQISGRIFNLVISEYYQNLY